LAALPVILPYFVTASASNGIRLIGKEPAKKPCVKVFNYTNYQVFGEGVPMKTKPNVFIMSLVSSLLIIIAVLQTTAQSEPKEKPDDRILKTETMGVMEGSNKMIEAAKKIRQASQMIKEGKDKTKAGQILADAEKIMSEGETLMMNQVQQMTEKHGQIKANMKRMMQNCIQMMQGSKIMREGMMLMRQGKDASQGDTKLTQGHQYLEDAAKRLEQK
jgi:hypothetical protein